MACGGAAPPSVSPPPRPPLGPLALLAPEGASSVLVLHPSELLVSTATQRIVGALASDAAFNAFTTRTGIDPRRITEAVFAEYPDGSLILVRGPFDARLAVEETGSRMTTVESALDQPLMRRAGFIGNSRLELVALEPDVLAIGEGLVTELTHLITCVNQRDTTQCATALSVDPVHELWEDHKRSHCVLYLPEHPALPEGYGTSMLLAGVGMMAVIATPLGSDALVLDVDMRGTFPDGAEENFRALLTNIGNTELGLVLGLDVGAERLAIERAPARLELHTSLPVTALINGLRALFVADIRELLGGVERSSITP